jgi:hypothetical protein
MKHLRNLNEMSDDSIINKFIEIREIFIEFEDLHIIEYRPGHFAAPRFSGEINYTYFKRQMDFIFKRSDDVRYITACIKFPTQAIVGFLNDVIESENIELINELFTALNRLNEAGFKFKLDLDNISRVYKPIEIIIYF